MSVAIEHDCQLLYDLAVASKTEFADLARNSSVSKLLGIVECISNFHLFKKNISKSLRIKIQKFVKLALGSSANLPLIFVNNHRFVQCILANIVLKVARGEVIQTLIHNGQDLSCN